MNSLVQVLLLLIVIGGSVGLFFVVRRQRYLRSLTEQGWAFENSPTLAATYGLNCPPFGLGYGRHIDDLITGRTAQGVDFAVFEYGRLGYVATLALPRPLPELYVASQLRPGAQGLQKPFGPWTVTAKDPAWAEAAMGAISGSLGALSSQWPVDVSVDGTRLVALGAPREAVSLRAFLDALGPVAVQLAGPSLSGYTGEQPPAELSLYSHPSWIYRPSDDRFLSQVAHDGSGYSHEAVDVVLAEVHGLRMIGLTHNWKTDRTETSTDSDGRTTTRTVTDNHSEPVLEFHLPWHFGDLSVNWSGWGDRVRFESSDFDRAFKVRCQYPKFASDVFHPRQMEFMLRAQPLPFSIDSGRVRIGVGANDPAVMARTAEFLVAFFAGVPNFVWEDLGFKEPPISRELDGF